jgi:transposase InsO family protein
MDPERFTSAVRLELRPGEWVLWDLRPHRFESLRDERARIRDTTSNEVREVAIASLRALPSLSADDLDARLEQQRDIDPALWSIAKSREALIREIITQEGATEAKVRDVAATLLKRIRALDARHVARRRLGAKAAQSVTVSTSGMLEARDALELIQIDHTLADVIVVDSRYRKPIGRPWLSVAIDVATRCVLGVHIALEARSALAVALAEFRNWLSLLAPDSIDHSKDPVWLPSEIWEDSL